MDIRDLHWLAGLLEGEGYFGLGTKRGRTVARFALGMTDKDVVVRAGELIGVSVCHIKPGRADWSPIFRLAASGSRAVEVMRLMRPLCGERRAARIDSVLARHEPGEPPFKLTGEDVRQIKQRLADGGVSLTALGEAFGVSRQVISLVRDGVRTETPMRRRVAPYEVSGSADPQELNVSWLAGLLEGEGTFLLPSPSAPRSPSVVIQMTDRDIVERVARLIGVSCYAMPTRNPMHLPVFSARARGLRAVSVMAAIRDQMGARRSQRITDAVASYRPIKAGQKLMAAEAREVVSRKAAGEDSGALAAEFGVSRRTINRVAQGGRASAGVQLLPIGFDPPV